MANLSNTTPSPLAGYQNVVFQFDASDPTNISACVPLFFWTVNGLNPALTVLFNSVAASYDEVVQFNGVSASGPILV